MSYFAPEAQEYLESLEADLLRVDKEPPNPETIHQLFRTAHTLKGSAYTVGFQAIGDLTHHIEDFMGAVREGQLHSSRPYRCAAARDRCHSCPHATRSVDTGSYATTIHGLTAGVEAPGACPIGRRRLHPRTDANDHGGRTPPKM